MPHKPQTAALLSALDADGAVITRADAVAEFGRRALEVGMREAKIVRVLPGHYALASRSTAFTTRIAAASAWLPKDTAIGGVAACVLHGVCDTEPRRIRIATGTHTHPRVPRWLWLRRSYASVEVRSHLDLRVVALPDALVQAWEELPPREFTGLILDVIRERRVTSPEVLAALDRYPRVRRRKGLERVLHGLSEGVHSYLEHLADRTVLNHPALRRMPRQVELRAGGRRYVTDAFDCASRTAVEFDGRRFHGDELSRRRDLSRDADLASVGIVTLRFTFEDVRDRPEWVRRIIIRTMAARRTTVGN